MPLKFSKSPGGTKMNQGLLMHRCSKPHHLDRNELIHNSMTTRVNSSLEVNLNNPVSNDLIYRSLKTIDRTSQVKGPKKLKRISEYTCNTPEKGKMSDIRNIRMRKKFYRNSRKNKFQVLYSSFNKSSSEAENMPISQDIRMKDILEAEKD